MNLPSRILIVEKDHADAQSLTRLIAGWRRQSFVSSATNSLSDALSLLLREHFDAIILDLSYPALDGIAALHRVVEAGKDVPVLVIAENDEEDSALEAMRSGAKDYLVKSALSVDSLCRALLHVIERHRTEFQLHRASRLQAIGQLAGGVAHDFNNIILVIKSSCELLLERATPGSEEARVIDEMCASADRGAALIRQLLAFTRQQVLAPAVVSLTDTVRDAIHLLERLIGEDIELRSVMTEEDCFVRADPGQLVQILMNLAANSRDAISSHGSLEVRVQCVTVDVEFATSHRPQPPGRYVLLSVRDTGAGMDDLTRRRLFEPFFTTKVEGSGLGLATTYGIVKQSGGYIWIDSQVGEGTTVDVYLPWVEGKRTLQKEEAPRHHDLATSPRGNETVLLVEDDIVIRRLTRHALERYGYKVVSADSGQRALQIFDGIAGTVDLLITDVVMPRLSGPDLAEKLTAVKAGLKVLYLSGYPNESAMRRGVLDPARNYLEKPFSRDALLKKVRQVLSAADDPRR